MEEFIILISPFNTIYTYNSEYVPRQQHLNLESNNDLSKLQILPYIEKEILERYKNLGILNRLYYYAETQQYKEVIEKEHAHLNLNKYFEAKFILKNELKNLTEKNKKVIFITENIETDFDELVNNSNNFIRVINWMLYDQTDTYKEHQKKSLDIIKEQKYELIIECLRQINVMVEYCIKNINKNGISFRDLINKEFFKNSINCLYILDTDSTAKKYRKRELAQSSEKVKYFPFLHINFNTVNTSSTFNNFYPNIKVILQRIPYFYIKNQDYYINNIQNMLDSLKVVQLHRVDVLDILYNRYKVYNLIKDFIEKGKKDFNNIGVNVSVPFTLEFKPDANKSANENLENLKKYLKNNNLDYPFIIKPQMCDLHYMKFVYDENGLNIIFNDEKEYNDFILKSSEIIVQKFISHGGEMIKSYSINEEAYSFIRPSLPDDCKNSIGFLNEIIYNRDKNDVFKNIDKSNESATKELLNTKIDITNKITLLFVEITKITFFGLDFLYDAKNDVFYILEVNYFPSYRELGNKLHYKFDEHTIKYYNKYI